MKKRTKTQIAADSSVANCTPHTVPADPAAGAFANAPENNQSPIIDNQSAQSVPPRRGGKPFQPLPEFASLPREQLDYIHDTLRAKTYEDAQQEIWSTLGCRISTNRLQRYRETLDLAAALEIADEDTLTAVDQLNALLAARETNFPAAGIHLIQQRALALSASPKTSPTLLKDLFRIFTYEDRKQEKQQTLALRHTQRLELAHLREQTRLQISADRRATAEQTLAHRKEIDSQKLQLARERHALELRKQEHREKLAAAQTPNPNANDEAAMRAEALLEFGRQLRRQREAAAAQSLNGGTSSTSPTYSSRDAVTQTRTTDARPNQTENTEPTKN